MRRCQVTMIFQQQDGAMQIIWPSNHMARYSGLGAHRMEAALFVAHVRDVQHDRCMIFSLVICLEVLIRLLLCRRSSENIWNKRRWSLPWTPVCALHNTGGDVVDTACSQCPAHLPPYLWPQTILEIGTVDLVTSCVPGS